jgi:uncharacterized protein YkwD
MVDALMAFMAGVFVAVLATVSSWFAPTPPSEPLSVGFSTSTETAIIAPVASEESPLSPRPLVSTSTRDIPSPPSTRATTNQPPATEATPPVSQIAEGRRQETTPGTMAVLSSSENPLSSQGLSVVEIVALTNLERIARGLAPLTLNARLNAMAEAKAVDMISHGYFAHVSPSGVDIGTLATTYGYEYIRVGENLALGDFASSSHVVTGWMRSPGHRENILEPEFTEIGVAVMRGEWEGREVWWAVQEFGKPLPNCPAPDELLKKKIEIFDEQLAMLKQTLDGAKKELDSIQSPAMYREKVEEYNLLVDLFNGLLETQKTQVAQFNQSVAAYNACIGE